LSRAGVSFGGGDAAHEAASTEQPGRAVMRRGDGVFSAQERKTAIWALLIAGMIVALGFVVQQWTHPSLGPGGAAAWSTASTPGVLDARPIT